MLENFEPINLDDLEADDLDFVPMENDGYDYSFDDFDSGSWDSFQEDFNNY